MMNQIPTKNNRLFRILPILLAVLFFVLACAYYFTNIPATVTFVDVGQGDACLIQIGKNGNVLIDGGDEGSGATLQSFLASQNVRKLHAVFITHCHTDHMTGIIELIQSGFPVEMLYLPQHTSDSEDERELIALIHEKQLPFRRLQDGEVLTIGNAIYHVLWPKQKATYMKANNQSLVLRMDYGENRILFTGDIEASAQIELCMEQPDEIQANILKVPHHGGETAVLTPFIEACNPQISVIGVGMNNLHGHPSPEMLDALNQVQSMVYRTDFHGNVKLTLDKRGIKRIDYSDDKWRMLH